MKVPDPLLGRSEQLAPALRRVCVATLGVLALLAAAAPFLHEGVLRKPFRTADLLAVLRAAIAG